MKNSIVFTPQEFKKIQDEANLVNYDIHTWFSKFMPGKKIRLVFNKDSTIQLITERKEI
jgi:hypothetical protein